MAWGCISQRWNDHKLVGTPPCARKVAPAHCTWSKSPEINEQTTKTITVCHRLLHLEPCWGCSGTQRAGSKWRLSCACRLDRHTLEAKVINNDKVYFGRGYIIYNVTILTETSHGVWDVSWHFGIGRLPLWISSSSAHSISGSCEQGNSSFTFTGHR